MKFDYLIIFASATNQETNTSTTSRLDGEARSEMSDSLHERQEEARNQSTTNRSGVEMKKLKMEDLLERIVAENWRANEAMVEIASTSPKHKKGIGQSNTIKNRGEPATWLFLNKKRWRHERSIWCYDGVYAKKIQGITKAILMTNLEGLTSKSSESSKSKVVGEKRDHMRYIIVAIKAPHLALKSIAPITLIISFVRSRIELFTYE
ncbi:hypothetical protein RND71_031968 [Anisodus tanguticus]|uniref:Uncharacterized protein n=1 Tax=Anisodus tanguticus TaxID=243964 RepID=A0AAE1RCT9_9SOLA|nr:hypothetical protein RND71_031968 [Anisodus tanguticus]